MLKLIQEELDSLAPQDTELTPALLGQLEYLNDVIREGMRLWPVTAFGPLRKAPQDIVYKGLLIPKGSSCSVSNFGLFRYGFKVWRF